MEDGEIAEKLNISEFISKTKLYRANGMKIPDADVKAIYHTTSFYII